MEELDLKYIVPYLIHDLKALRPWDGEKSKVTFSNFELLFKYSKLGFAKPILHPLSDLTKEIEVNGEKFIPIIELFKTYVKDKAKKAFDIKTFYYSDTFGCTAKFESKIIPNSISFKFSRFSSFVYGEDSYKKEVIYFENQLILFEKLFEWNFDLNGLIEKGLAIDINTL